MNYGDGYYGGVFLSALYAEAFLKRSPQNCGKKALLSLPAESDYAKVLRDVLMLKDKNPDRLACFLESFGR